MDDEMYDTDSSDHSFPAFSGTGTRTTSTTSSSHSYPYRYSYGSSTYSYSPPRSPVRAEPIRGYELRFAPDGVQEQFGQQGQGAGGRKCIDLVFVLDCTGSMQKYINATRDHVVGICDMIRGEEGLGGPDDLRVAVINYRDHPPQDHSYVYRCNPFTSDVGSVQQYLQTLVASGGGDGPEAVTAGLAACLTDLEWRRAAAKMVVLIADAPPHGIGESGDQIRGGDPDGHDPLVVARTMASNGITLFMVACEETLSNYSKAVDFFSALCSLTSGVMLPLMTADMLAMTIVGSVLENMDMERLIEEIGYEVANRIKQKGETMQSVEEVAQELHERLLLRNEQTKQVHLPEVYITNENTKRNVQTWMSANLIQDAVKDIIHVPGKRLTDKFRTQNRESGFQYTPGGALPPRRRPSGAPSSSVGIPGAPPTPSTPGHPSSFLPSPPGTPSGPGFRSSSASHTPISSATSPSRRVVSDFKAFGSPEGAAPISVFGAKVLPTGPGGGMFGSMGMRPTFDGQMRDPSSSARGRGGMMMDDDDDDEDEGPGLRREAISLDQARRIATQSVFRAGRLG